MNIKNKDTIWKWVCDFISVMFGYALQLKHFCFATFLYTNKKFPFFIRQTFIYMHIYICSGSILILTTQTIQKCTCTTTTESYHCVVFISCLFSSSTIFKFISSEFQSKTDTAVIAGAVAVVHAVVVVVDVVSHVVVHSGDFFKNRT